MSSSREDRSRQAVFVLSAGALAGVLIWSKLRLVTDIPRSAYAVPEGEENAQPPEAHPVHPDQVIDPVIDPDADPEVGSEPNPEDESGTEIWPGIEPGATSEGAGTPGPTRTEPNPP